MGSSLWQCPVCVHWWIFFLLRPVAGWPKIVSWAVRNKCLNQDSNLSNDFKLVLGRGLASRPLPLNSATPHAQQSNVNQDWGHLPHDEVVNFKCLCRVSSLWNRHSQLNSRLKTLTFYRNKVLLRFIHETCSRGTPTSCRIQKVSSSKCNQITIILS